MTGKKGGWAVLAVVGTAAASATGFMAANDPKEVKQRIGNWLGSGVEVLQNASPAVLLGGAVAIIVVGIMLWRRQAGSVAPASASSLRGIAPTGMTIGETQTSWLRFWGNGEQRIAWSDVDCRIVPGEIKLPAALRRLERREEQRIERDGKHNSEMLALASFDRREQANTEKPRLHVRFETTVYARYLAVTLNEAGQDAKAAQLEHWRPGEPLPSWMMQGVGVQIGIVTCDDRLIYVDRSRTGTTPRAGELDFGAVEGISKYLDADAAGSRTFALRNVFERALDEEFGIKVDEIEELELLGLGYDAAYSQVNFIGFARTSLSTLQVRDSWAGYASSVQEFSNVMGVPIDDLTGIRALLERQRIWSSGLACVNYTLIRLLGKRAVADALKGLHVHEVSAPTF